MKLPQPLRPVRAKTKEAITSGQSAGRSTYLCPTPYTLTNCEEADEQGIQVYPANFTKGLAHDVHGVLEFPEDYQRFVTAINAPEPEEFENGLETAATRHPTELYYCQTKVTCHGREAVAWRHWESPLADHCHDFDGAYSYACGMAPAPRVGSSELSFEMAEVYAMAILRDVPFKTIAEGGDQQLCAADASSTAAQLSAEEIVALLKSMPFLSGKEVLSSTPHATGVSNLNDFESKRRFARTLSDDGNLTAQRLFRGSTSGDHQGPYISQFMLIGGKSLAVSKGIGRPGIEAGFDLQDGLIPYGSLLIDQRTFSHKNGLDYMTDWRSWLDVQNGADLSGADLFEGRRRFITTPRDLATYVHFDALNEAYLNAYLILKTLKTPRAKGLPGARSRGGCDVFETYSDAHTLSLLAEVATRCLKAIRRQKFNYHRRARPEALGGRFVLQAQGLGDKLGCSQPAFARTLAEIPEQLLDAIDRHNRVQNHPRLQTMRRLNYKSHNTGNLPNPTTGNNYLLPIAFPEGSPMHPSYGATHAAVAGGCVTLLKAIFQMFTDATSFRERELRNDKGDAIAFEPDYLGSELQQAAGVHNCLTVQGELDKLAANISLGRNMAGLHYYSDYFDSLRMGERVAVNLLLEHLPTLGKNVEIAFKSFDGDYIRIESRASKATPLSILSNKGNPVDQNDWWLRHVAGGSNNA